MYKKYRFRFISRVAKRIAKNDLEQACYLFIEYLFTDIDECKTNNPCNTTLSTCKNKVPGYHCKCKHGLVNKPGDKDKCIGKLNERLMYICSYCCHVAAEPRFSTKYF